MSASTASVSQKENLRLLPAQLKQDRISTANAQEAHHDYAIHDTMRQGPRSVQHDLLPAHPLESVLSQWNETQEKTRMAMHRQVYGIHAPMRAQMEKAILGQIQTRLPALPSSRLGLSVLQGKDESLEFDDYLNDPELAPRIVDVAGSAEVYRMGLAQQL